MKPITLRQAKMIAKKTNAPFSCNILAQNGFFGLSTVFMFHDRFIVLAPWQWETPRHQYGIIACNRRLTENERRDFELEIA